MKSKLKLTDREWGKFFLDEIAQIHHGVRLTKADMVAGSCPFIGASEAANGVTGFVGNRNASLDKDVLGVNYNGSVGFAFYHPYGALFSDDVKRVRWKNQEANNKYTLLYLSTVIAQQREKYAYGYKFNAQRMKRQIIRLPITNEGQPDWEFMKAYMEQIEDELLAEALPRLEQQLTESMIALGPLEGREWKEFMLTDLFTAIRGNQNNMSSLQNGDLPLISAKKDNNGLKGFVLDNKLFSAHCITLNLDGDGGAGLAFYQASPFALDSHVVALYPRKTLDKWVLLFAARTISAQCSRFGHGRAINLSRLNHFLLMLPIQANGTPDWEFMSAFMKRMEREVLLTAIKHFRSAHASGHEEPDKMLLHGGHNSYE